MFKTVLSVVFSVLVLVSGAAAQQPQPSPSVKPEAAGLPAPARPGAQPVNIRLELTITDQRGDGPASSKALMMIVADRENGRIRTGRGNVHLNVDARPEITREGRIRVLVTLEYRPQTSELDKMTGEPMATVESLTAIVEDGKPIVVSQSADPGSDRQVKVELKATLVK